MIDAHIQLPGSEHFLDTLDRALEFSGASGVIALQTVESDLSRHTCLDTAKESEGFICGIVSQMPWGNDKQVKVLLDRDEREELIVGYLADLRKVELGAWLNDEDITHNLRLISQRNIPLDILTTTEQIPYLLPLIDAHPDLHIVLDHCSGAAVNPSSQWARTIREAGRRPHVYYRLSGLTPGLRDESTYAIAEAVKPCFGSALEAFGAERILYGSGWPDLSSPYPAWLNAVDSLTNELSSSEQEAIYGKNALDFYGVS